LNKCTGAEAERLSADAARTANWKRWGPYLAERQWGTVREDYSADGNAWKYFPHDDARSRAYRWGEDGLLGFTDRECRLCFAVALWNGQDPILKERLFGLDNSEGNHGEDVKECYFYLDSTPTHSYVKSLYKYPQRAYPYEQLIEENRKAGRNSPEWELTDSDAFAESRYFDVFAEYAKAAPDDITIRLTIANRGPVAAAIDVLPTLWFRNTWSWGEKHPGEESKPGLELQDGAVLAHHATLQPFRFEVAPENGGATWLFTENATNTQRLHDEPNTEPHVKDAFHEYILDGNKEAVHPSSGTKAAAHYHLEIPAGEQRVLYFRLSDSSATARDIVRDGEALFNTRIAEADEFYRGVLHGDEDEQRIGRQAYAGLLHSKQFYHYVVREWLDGDPSMPPPSEERKQNRNANWTHLYNRDVILMPDKWEYPWYAAWDLAFHCVAIADVDPQLAKEQLVLFLREWYLHPNGQLPAYEWALNDVNPPVHAWAAWRIYKITGERGGRDRAFLERVFQKLLLNFTWWVNRKDPLGNNLFAGGFLGMDNIGVFDRSSELPNGATLEQADGTAWMAFYCVTMLSMALELAREDPVYEDMASKFFEHFVAIVDAMNTAGGSGLWDEEDGFYYDKLLYDHQTQPLRIRSMVGLVPLYAAEILYDETLDALPSFTKRMNWFLQNRPSLAQHITDAGAGASAGNRLLSIPSKERLERLVCYLLDESEFLSPYGVRSLSKAHCDQPFTLQVDGQQLEVQYAPGESTTSLFGGNSNWRGPIWMPVNYMLIEALERYGLFYGDTLQVECPQGSGNEVTLTEAARIIEDRLCALFGRGESGSRPIYGADRRYTDDPHWRDLLLFHEYFHGEHGAGLGASHQTGWTALIARLLGDCTRSHE
jgi:hypothetical protein